MKRLVGLEEGQRLPTQSLSVFFFLFPPVGVNSSLGQLFICYWMIKLCISHHYVHNPSSDSTPHNNSYSCKMRLSYPDDE